MAFHNPSIDMPPLLVGAPPYPEGDRVKWIGPPRLQSNGYPLPNHLLASVARRLKSHVVSHACVLAGKTFYSEVSVAMAGVSEGAGSSTYGLTPMGGKTGFGQDLDWCVTHPRSCFCMLFVRLAHPGDGVCSLVVRLNDFVLVRCAS